MKRHIYILVGCMVAVMSCSSPQTGIDDFDRVTEITAYDSIYSDRDSIFGSVSDMEIQNGLLALEHYGDAYQYSFIDVHTGEMLKRWGKTGQGPNEFIDFGQTFTLRDSTLIFMEWAKKKIHRVSVKDILKGEKTLRNDSLHYPYVRDFRPRTVCFVDGNQYFTGAFKEGHFGIINKDNQMVTPGFDFPFSTDPLEGIFRGYTFQNLMRASEAQKKFVLMALWSDVFEIFQCSGDSVRKVYTSPFSHPPKIMKKGARYGIDYKNSIGGLGDVAVSDQLICFKYSPAVGEGRDAPDIILSFDWSGNKVRKYILPFSIGAFCIDEQYIYGVHEYEDYSVVYRFKLGES